MYQPTLFAAQSLRHEGQRAMSTERLLNMLPEASPGGRLPVTLRSAPGLTNVVQLGAGAVRAMISDDENLYAAVGGTLVKWDGTTVTTLGTIADATTVMDHNPTQIALAAGGNYYVSDKTTVSAVSGGALTSVGSVAFLDTYFVRGPTTGATFDLTANNDGNTLDALDFATAEYKPDKLVRVLANNGLLWLLGSKTVEAWQNTGDGDFPFSRLNSTVLEKGLFAADTVAELDNSFIWVSPEKRAYRQEGFSPQKVSTNAVDASLDANTVTGCFTYQWQGHDFFVVRFEDRPAWVYDASTQSWHERGTEDGAWKATSAVLHNATWYVGTSDGYLCTLGGYQDQGAELWREAVSRNLSNAGNEFVVTSLDVRLSVGEGGSVMHSYSPNGGVTFSQERVRSLGELGAYGRRFRLNAKGKFDEFALKLRCTDNVDFAIFEAGANIK